MLFVYISIHISIQMIKLTSAATHIYITHMLFVCTYIYKYIYKYTENKLISAAIYTYIYIYSV